MLPVGYGNVAAGCITGKQSIGWKNARRQMFDFWSAIAEASWIRKTSSGDKVAYYLQIPNE